MSSFLKLSVKLFTAALVAQYIDPPAYGSRPIAVDLVSFALQNWAGVMTVFWYTGNGANVDYITGTAIGPFPKYGKHGLGHIDQPSNVCSHHDADIFLRNVWCAGDPFDETTVLSVNSKF